MQRLTLERPASMTIPRRSALLLGGRWAGAAMLAATAAIHLRLYTAYDYRSIPTIGALFLANGVAGSLLALAVAAAPRRLLWPAALGGAALEVGTLAGFVVALNHPLFGFQDSTRAPLAYPAMVVEIVGTVVLVAVAVAALSRARGSGGLRGR